MSFEETSCILVRCDQCRQILSDDGIGIHFQSREAALAVAEDCGWLSLGERQLCKDCVDQQSCGLIGHNWSNWVAVDNARYNGRFRHCSNCPYTEYDPPLSAT